MRKDGPKREVPQFDEFMNPTLQAQRQLGGSASIDELVSEIVQVLRLPQNVTEVPHGTTGRTEMDYRAAFRLVLVHRSDLDRRGLEAPA